jgi:zinc protease
MKVRNYLKIFILLMILAVITSVTVLASQQQGGAKPEDASKPPSEAMKIIEKMQFKPITVKVPKIGKDVERVVLKNGMILYLKEDNRYPVVNIRGAVRTGEVYENRDKFGVARLTGKVMRTGGTRKMSPDDLNRELEYMASSIESSTHTWEGEVGMSVISSQLDRGLTLFSEILRHPAFDEKELDLAKNEIKETLIRSTDKSDTIGNNHFNNLLFPNYAPGWQYDWDVVKNIKRQDLIDWHKRFYVPNNMMFAVVGDFKKDEMIAKFNKLFGDWPQGKVNHEITQKVSETAKPGVYYVKKDVSQSFIAMGHLGVEKGNPDRFALVVMNHILGRGGFGSLMTERVRSDEGLAYSVWSYMRFDQPMRAEFVAQSSTRNDATIKAAEIMLAQIKRIQNEKMEARRIDWAKNSLINGFVFEFDEPYQQTVKLMMLEYNDRPRDFFETYTDNIKKVTAEDVQRVAQKYLTPDKMIFLFVGNTDQYDKPLSTLGETTEIILKNPIKD